MNRVAWMENQGKKLFSQWTAELLQTADTPDFWRVYQAGLLKDSPGITTPGVVLGPDQVVPCLTSEFRGALSDVDRQQGIGRAILLPFKDEILHYTGAADRITRNNCTPEDAVLMHARDSLRFAVGFSAGVINDVFLQNTFMADRSIRRQASLLDDGNSTEKRNAYEKVIQCAGDWWDASLESPSFKIDWLQVDGLFGLQKLAFTARSLGNVTLVDQLEAMTAGGFDAIGDRASFPVERMLSDVGSPPEEGWINRTRRFKLKRPEGVKGPFALLEYNRPSDTFKCRPEVAIYLRDSLRQQNRHGLPDKSYGTAGNLPQLEPATPFSRGCPVANTGILPMTNNFLRKAYEVTLELHQRYWKGETELAYEPE
ncbi:MAG TPA: hypothetical protein VLF43_01690 [Candidatus Saccharimonadales bacterium]|nr:hypothetical protein [Candidatus Saccharimonadales bacterium]